MLGIDLLAEMALTGQQPIGHHVPRTELVGSDRQKSIFFATACKDLRTFSVEVGGGVAREFREPVHDVVRKERAHDFKLRFNFLGKHRLERRPYSACVSDNKVAQPLITSTQHSGKLTDDALGVVVEMLEEA